MNTQGMLFTEEQAKEYYGNRYEFAILVWVELDSDNNVIEGKSQWKK